MAWHPQDVAFINFISNQRTRRDRAITSQKILGNQLAISGFTTVKWRSIASGLVQFDRTGFLRPSLAGNGVNIVTENRLDTSEQQFTIADPGKLTPEFNLAPDPASSHYTASVNKITYTFIIPEKGIMTDHLAAIAANSITLDIAITSEGISVYTLSKNNVTTSLYATIQKWKAGAGESLKVRSRRTFTEQKKTQRRKKRSTQRSRWF